MGGIKAYMYGFLLRKVFTQAFHITYGIMGPKSELFSSTNCTKE